MDTSPNTGAQPHYSPDGRWWWNGRQWLPVQPQVPQQQPRSTFWPVLGALLAFAVIAVIAFALYSSERADQQRKDEFDSYMCERWGSCG